MEKISEFAKNNLRITQVWLEEGGRSFHWNFGGRNFKSAVSVHLSQDTADWIVREFLMLFINILESFLLFHI